MAPFPPSQAPAKVINADTAWLYDLENEMLWLKEVIQEMDDTTRRDREVAEMIRRGVDIAREDLQTELDRHSGQMLGKLDGIPDGLARMPCTCVITYQENQRQTPDDPPPLEYGISDYGRGKMEQPASSVVVWCE